GEQGHHKVYVKLYGALLDLLVADELEREPGGEAVEEVLSVRPRQERLRHRICAACAVGLINGVLRLVGEAERPSPQTNRPDASPEWKGQAQPRVARARHVVVGGDHRRGSGEVRQPGGVVIQRGYVGGEGGVGAAPP